MNDAHHITHNYDTHNQCTMYVYCYFMLLILE